MSFGGLRSHPLAETHAYTTAVFVSELDAGGLKRAANCQIVGCRHGCLPFGEFSRRIVRKLTDECEFFPPHSI